jgi:hypothetical protein
VSHMGSKKMRDRRDGPSDIPPDAVRKHLHEMLRGGFPSYSLFDAIHKADLPEADKATLLKEGAQIVEFALANRAKVGSEISATAQTITGFGMPEARDAMVAWRKTVEGCISLRGLQLVLRHFGDWLKQAKPDRRGGIYLVLPRLAPLAAELGDKELAVLLRTATSPKTTKGVELMLAVLEEYAFTSAPILTAMVRIGRQACFADALPVMKRLTEAMPAPKLINHRDGRRMIRALDRLNDFCEKGDGEVWREAFDLAAVLGSKSYAGTHICARDLPKILPSLPDDCVADYLRGVNKLVRAIGVGATDFALSRLPALYRRHGPKRTNAFVHAAAATGEAYGATAAWWLLDQKTSAAQQMLGRG